MLGVIVFITIPENPAVSCNKRGAAVMGLLSGSGILRPSTPINGLRWPIALVLMILEEAVVKIAQGCKTQAPDHNRSSKEYKPGIRGHSGEPNCKGSYYASRLDDQDDGFCQNTDLCTSISIFVVAG